ncbi:MAG: helix-turn-helix transcriptional regulator [Cellulosilyticum sp.]|nr:helix-turn-helix transcriptional regulator [Cellulosilyticum sp.]
MSFSNSLTPKPTPSYYTLQPINTYATEFSYPNRLSIIFIESGNGYGKIDDTPFDFAGPTVICLNHLERLILTRSTNLKGHILTFAPTTIKDYFTFENIKTFDHCFSPTDISIAINLSIFYQRSKSYIGQIPISEPTIKQLYKILDQLNRCNDSIDSISAIIVDILAPIKRLVQANVSVSNVIIAETSLEVKDVLMYLHDNCKHKITIPKLSKQFHVNRTTLSDRFFEATGETIITYLNKYRINLAAIMLRESTSSISNIAEEVGFNDTAYFAKLFKKYMFHTPSGYRQHYVSLCHVHKTDD